MPKSCNERKKSSSMNVYHILIANSWLPAKLNCKCWIFQLLDPSKIVSQRSHHDCWSPRKSQISLNEVNSLKCPKVLGRPKLFGQTGRNIINGFYIFYPTRVCQVLANAVFLGSCLPCSGIESNTLHKWERPVWENRTLNCMNRDGRGWCIPIDPKLKGWNWSVHNHGTQFSLLVILVPVWLQNLNP